MLIAIELVRAILGPVCRNNNHAAQVVAAATQADVDLLGFISRRFDIDEDIVYERAAHFCTLPFSPAVPRLLSAPRRITRIDTLGSHRTIRGRLFDRMVLFLAPGTNELLALKAHMAEKPDTRRNMCIVPPNALTKALLARHSNALMHEARQRLARRWPFASSHLDLTLPTRIIFTIALALVLIGTIAAPLWLEPFLLPLLVIFFLLPAWLRLSVAFVGTGENHHPHAPALDDKDLPTYSILIPLRDEAHMVPQLVQAMTAIDYPPEKLDVKFIVESASTKTITAVEAILGNTGFQLICVPDAAPHTKPKALNFALPLARGSMVVVYDAEDIPDPDQLRQTAAIFHADPSVDCIQAELVIDNAHENWLTALFSAEYSALFGIIMPALARWRLPMPLGGTSNHFRIDALREVGGWDAFNVTEDADLGVRLSRLRYRTTTITSRTREEAPTTYKGWIRQRTRWIKGWMQTFIVHNHHPRQFLRDMGWCNFLAFQVLVGSMIFSAPLHTFFLLSLTARLVLGETIGLTPMTGWAIFHLFVLVAGYTATITLCVLGMRRLNQRHLLIYQLALPFYWALTGVASFLAVIELLTRPYFWAKTEHRVSRKQHLPPPHTTAPPQPGSSRKRSSRKRKEKSWIG